MASYAQRVSQRESAGEKGKSPPAIIECCTRVKYRTADRERLITQGLYGSGKGKVSFAEKASLGEHYQIVETLPELGPFSLGTGHEVGATIPYVLPKGGTDVAIRRLNSERL